MLSGDFVLVYTSRFITSFLNFFCVVASGFHTVASGLPSAKFLAPLAQTSSYATVNERYYVAVNAYIVLLLERAVAKQTQNKFTDFLL